MLRTKAISRNQVCAWFKNIFNTFYWHVLIRICCAFTGSWVLMIALVNLTGNKTVLPWTIYSTEVHGISVQEFYSTKIVCEVKKNYLDESVLDFESLANLLVA